MKTKVTHPSLAPLYAFVLSTSLGHSAIVVYSEHDFGAGYTVADSAPFTTSDTSGNGRAGLNTSGTGFSILDDGVSGTAFRQNGSLSGLQYMQDKTLLSGVPNNNWGLGFYFRVATSGQSSGTFMQLNGGTGSPAINFEIGTNNVIRVSRSGDGNSFNYNSSFASASGATVGDWDHLALINVNGDTKLYLNGVQVGNTYTGVIDLSQINFAIRDGGGGELNHGDFDYFKVVTFDGTDTATDALSALTVVPEPRFPLLGLFMLPLLLRRRRV